ncbi:uncharacterized protein [Amphiura filiformis]|uniref:uncharacterized protein n=1 Tax=Amphiura filiformis TaxID=82378 RepID=UPI003B228A56
MKAHICHICQKEVKAIGNLKQHIKSHKQETHICHICQKEIKGYIGNLKQHIKRHNQETHICFICQKEVKGTLSNHKCIRRCQTERLTCGKCKRVISEYQFETHQNGHTQDEKYQTATGVLKCMNCFKCYDDIAKLGTHRGSYCPLDAVGEKNENNDTAVEGTIENVQQSNSAMGFKCDACDAQFESFSSLEAHSASHLKLQRFKKQARCPTCNLVFATFHYLEIHNRVVHINKGLRMCKCDICHKEFSHKYLLNQHKQMRHGKETLKCRYCVKIFAAKKLLSSHVRDVHTEKHVCEYCGKLVRQHKPSGLAHKNGGCLNKNKLKPSKKKLPADVTVDTVVTADVTASSSNGTDADTASLISKSQQIKSVMSQVSTLPEHYRCKKCRISFENRENYVVHKRTCQLADKMENNFCHEADDEIEAEGKVYTCEACPEIFNSMLKFRAHETKHASVVCKDCGEIVPDEETLEMHVLFECPERYKLLSIETPRDAVPSVSGISEETGYYKRNKPPVEQPDVERSCEEMDNGHVFVCKICNREVSKDTLNKHQISHKEDQLEQSDTGQFECPQCLKHYKETNNYCLSQHMKYWCRQYDYVCRICSAKFEDAVLLSVHEMVHVVHVIANQSEAKLKQDSTEIIDDISEEMEEESLEETTKAKFDAQSGQIAEDIPADIEKMSVKICSSCNVEFTSAAALKEHQKRVSLTELKYPQRCQMCSGHNRPVIVSACDHLQHKKQFKFFCQFCGKHFEENKSLGKHINRFHDYENKKECLGCHGIFGPQEYMQHVEYNRKEVEQLDQKCLSCGKVFDSVEALDKHASYRFKYTCDICFRHCYHFIEFEKHRKQYHSITYTKPISKQLPGYWCKHCDKFFEKASLLSAHVKSVLEEESSESLLCSWEHKNLTCLRCGMTFSKLSDYKLHTYICRYECDMCHEHFQVKSNLSYHRQEHILRQNAGKETCTVPQFIKCKYCGLNFDTVVDKRKHESKMAYEKAYQTIKFPIPCEDCSEMLETKCQMDIHKTRHKQRQ